MHHRVIAGIWFLFGLLGFAFTVVDLSRLPNDAPQGVITSDLLALSFSVLAIITAIGVFRARLWARVMITIVAVALAIYSLASIAMLGPGFDLFRASYWLALLLAAYTLIVGLVKRNPLSSNSL